MRPGHCLPLLVLACTARPGQSPFVPASGSPLALESGGSNVALGDLNGDGHLDLAVGAGRACAITVLWGDGTGGFASAPNASIALGAPPGEMVLADFDRDGKLDLGIASHDSYAVAVLLGDGRGGFAPAPGSPFAAASGGKPHNHGLAVGDANEDGHLDLVTIQSDDGTVAVLLGNGRGGFSPAPAPPFTVGPSPYPPALGDLDGDGHLDIAVPETGMGRYWREHRSLARTITLLLGDGSGGFRPAPGSPLTVTAGPYYVALGDLDGDGALDLVATHDDAELVTILLNDGKGRFRPAPQSPLEIGRRAWEVVIIDANADGKSDLVLGTGDSVTVLLGDGSGGFSPAPGSPLVVGRGAWRLAVGDLDHDGKLDVVTSNVESSSISVLLGR
ncbi:MAG TPA: VCBS repeat-containing protein [Planctomycetota bacterium]|nr:VCBS repeat-containing protein [Planctomycetota bacterium]